MRKLIIAVVLALTCVGSALAVVTFDSASGKGFVGKGDVQLLFGMNNKALQDVAGKVDFRVNSVSATSWTCTKVVELGNGGENTIVQERLTTVSTQGVVTTVARDNSKGKDGPVTGFNLLGYEGVPTVVSLGPAVGTCPANPSGFVYDENASTQISGGGLEVTIDGSNWLSIG
jgi:hypothetical protein